MLRLGLFILLSMPIYVFGQTCNDIQYFIKEAGGLFKNCKGKQMATGGFECTKKYGSLKGGLYFDVGCMPIASFYKDSGLLYKDALKEVEIKKAFVIKCLSSNKKWSIYKNDSEFFSMRKAVSGKPEHYIVINIYVGGDYNKNRVYTDFGQSMGCPE